MPESLTPRSPIRLDLIRQVQDLSVSTFKIWTVLVQQQRAFALGLLDAVSIQKRDQDGRFTRPDGAEPSAPMRTADEKLPRRALERAIEELSTASATAPRTRRAQTQPAAHEFPIKRYDSLSVEQVAARLRRLTDPKQVRLVLSYESNNKGRKGVAAAGDACLAHLASK